jgi:hypothetical protein
MSLQKSTQPGSPSTRFPRPELLLHSLIPPPLHGMAPRTILGARWWDNERRKAMAHNMWKCWACNIPKTKAKKHKWLEGHESYDIDWKAGTCRLIEITSLCHYCHNYIHRGRLEVLLRAGRLDQPLYDDILKHGNNLTAHLSRPQPIKEMAPWPEWVLIIDGTPYQSRFKSATEWETYYGWINSAGIRDDEQSFTRFQEILKDALSQR